MYIDDRKFDYSKFDYSNAEELIARDKQFARDAYRKWFEDSVEKIVDRLWEINDIGAIEQVGDFVKLLKEAEFTFSIGAFTSSIALVGVCAEDLCRFFAKNAGHNLDSETQFKRINELLRIGVISRDIADKFHAIRNLRNDCLHYNDGFKQKDNNSLKEDALLAINSIKYIYAQIMGVVNYRSIDSSKLSEMINIIAKEASSDDSGCLGFDDVVVKIRNIFAKAFGVDLSVNNHGAPVYKTSIYYVVEIDSKVAPPEIALKDFANGMVVVVDLLDRELSHIKQSGICEGDVIAASLMSIPNKLGVTGSWRIWGEIKKIG